jgi:hypothetical protein
MAYRTASGLELGLRVHRLWALLPACDLRLDLSMILSHATGLSTR